MKRFGVMMDMSRDAVMLPEQVKNMARILKSFGYNMIQLYTEDTYEVEDEPYFGYMRGRYTAEEIRDVVAYCEGIGVEVIPCIQTLAHLNAIFRWSDYYPYNDAGVVLLVEEERTYRLIENMFRTLRKNFKSEYVHIGMDEAYWLGRGRYLDKHGYENRFDILHRHLKKVVALAEKYGFKPIMWSDMFFSLANNGQYYSENPTVSEEAKKAVPDGVGLVYWDYEHTETRLYENMMKAHRELAKDVWFAGGVWTWYGFAGDNGTSMKMMFPAMDAAKSCEIENIFITAWGNNGKECSYFSMLPALYAIRRRYDGVTDMDQIKREFHELTGEDFDGMCALDLPNLVGGNDSCRGNVCKHMLYSDPFTGYLDSTWKEGVTEEYKRHAQTLSGLANGSAYGYIFESHAALCELLAVKYDLGVKTRKAYLANDREALKTLVADYARAVELLDDFYLKFQRLWFRENKPHGFDVHDLRLGGLKQRLISCRKRLTAYLNGEIAEIPELKEKLLCWFGNGENFCTDTPKNINIWNEMATVNII